MPSPLHLLAHKSARKFLNIRLGWRLMRDPRVPIAKKIVALGFGLSFTVLLLILQVPLEGILALVAPLIGLAADAAIDGAEMLVLPLLLALVLLPYMHREQEMVPVEIQVR